MLAHGKRASAAATPAPAWKPICVLSATWLLSLVLCAWLSSQRPLYAFYTLPSRFWQLMTGALLYEWQHYLVPSAAATSSVGVHASGERFCQQTFPKIVIALFELIVLALFAVAFTKTNGESGFPCRGRSLQSWPLRDTLHSAR